jgi:hypothetical protein
MLPPAMPASLRGVSARNGPPVAAEYPALEVGSDAAQRPPRDGEELKGHRTERDRGTSGQLTTDPRVVGQPGAHGLVEPLKRRLDCSVG